MADMTDAEIIDRIFKSEGGFVDDPADPGGATNFGITIGTLGRYRRAPVTVESVRNLTRDEAEAIYQHNYIAQPGYAGIPDGSLRYAVVDAGVQHGTGTATCILQKALGVPPDGVFGMHTLAAVRGADPGPVIASIVEQRRTIYNRLIASNPQMEKFRDGWANRLAEFVA